MTKLFAYRTIEGTVIVTVGGPAADNVACIAAMPRSNTSTEAVIDSMADDFQQHGEGLLVMQGGVLDIAKFNESKPELVREWSQDGIDLSILVLDKA